ncbi:MAG: anhydro-N-acetylmuramic acid kinase [Verrucomicrobia bacterium]|nr:anhydro-N-acetylmuramic acid kinase [Verrucomicrobiota bacterium]
MKKQLVLGIMSGTSLGSVDYALCEISGRKVKLKELWAVNYPKKLQDKLHEAAKGSLSSWDFCQLHHDLGRFYAEHAVRGKSKPQLVGLHGQTVFHNPSERNPATFQLGESAYLVEKLRAPVVNNFRAADLAAGGQGAPLATLFHEYAFAERGKHVCVNNLGGISNVTSLNWRNRKAARPEILSFDTGPANMLIDFAMRHFSGGKLEFDRNGSWAARGKANEPLLNRWLKHPYFRKSPPKSTGRELFGEPFFVKAIAEMKALSRFDAIATFTEFTARTVALNYQLHLGAVPDRVILTGGGASNPVLKEWIEQALRQSDGIPKVITSAGQGWPVEAIEPAAFALLAYLRLNKVAGNIPETTGAYHPVLCGTLADV